MIINWLLVFRERKGQLNSNYDVMWDDHFLLYKEAFIGKFEVYHIEESYGHGDIQRIKVCDGIELIYSEMFLNDKINEEEFLLDDAVEIHYRIKGSNEVELYNGRRVHISENDIIVYDLSKPTGEFISGDSRQVGISVVLKFGEADRAIRAMLGNEYVSVKEFVLETCKEFQCVNLETGTELTEIFKSLLRFNEPRFQEFLKLKALEVFWMCHKTLDEKTSTVKKQDHSKLERAVKIMKEHIEQPLNISLICDMINMSRSKFKIEFKAYYDDTPYSYYKRLRLAQAKNMMMDSSRNITDISSAVGYDNPSKFSAAFKNVYGLNPKEYRNQLCLMA